MISLKEINELERIFLELLDYKLFISGSEYAKYYFILRTFTENENKRFPLKPLPVEQMMTLQKASNNAEVNLKHIYQKRQRQKSF
jgi:hypothetical protein